MQLTSSCFAPNHKIPAENAFCIPNPASHVKLAPNRNPDLSWSDLPKGVKSLVLVCHDPDVPSRTDDVNQEGRIVPAHLSRVDFYHWLLVDMAPDAAPIRKGEFSDGVTPRGKKGPVAPRGTRQGINDYTRWFKNDKDMSGDYFGYDGPCPPWNDALLHRYIFTLYALDIVKCPVQGNFTGDEVLKAILGHSLANARLTGVYSLNPAVKL